MFTKEGKSGNEMQTVIGPSVHVEGNFNGSGDVIVEGSVVGTLKTTANLRVGASAHIKADVEAANIFLAGEIHGNTITVKDRLELTKSARVFGNVKAKTITMEAGAVLNGKVTMSTVETAAEPTTMDPPEKSKREPRD